MLNSILAGATGGAWASQYFAAVRQSAIAHAGVVSSIAVSLACIFIAFKLIRMYYDLVSDEQAGGFGGVRMWDILRPITLLLIVMTFGTWLSWLDSFCNSVASSLVTNMTIATNDIDEKTKAKLDELEEELSKSKKEIAEDAKKYANNTSGINSDKELEKIRRETIGGEGDFTAKAAALDPRVKGASGSLSDDGKTVTYQSWKDGAISFAIDDLLGPSKDDTYIKNRLGKMADYKGAKNREEEYKAQKREIRKWARWLNSGASIIGTLVNWFFNIFFVVMMAFADVMLCLLAMFGPLAAALSILDPWKQAFTSWLGHYIEVSLWKPVGSAVCWIVATVKTAVGNLGLDQAMNLQSADAKASIMGAVGAEVLILFAGIMAITQIPSITNTILSLGSMSDGYANSAANTMGSALRMMRGGGKGKSGGLSGGKGGPSGGNGAGLRGGGSSSGGSSAPEYSSTPTMWGDFD